MTLIGAADRFDMAFIICLNFVVPLFRHLNHEKCVSFFGRVLIHFVCNYRSDLS